MLGFGAGSFAQEYRDHQAASVAISTSASHTTPITVAAEQGIVGLLLYVLLVVCSLGVLFLGAGRAPPRLAILACFVALLVHTLAYADFLEDPIAWALLAIGIALAGGRRIDAQARVSIADPRSVRDRGDAMDANVHAARD
jgi:O-antigen ligase